MLRCLAKLTDLDNGQNHGNKYWRKFDFNEFKSIGWEI